MIPLLLAGDAGAQAQTANTPTPPENYSILSTGFGEFFPYDPGHDISATFPYTVKDVATGNVTRQNFNGAIHGRFTRPTYMINLLNEELVRKRNSIDMGFGLFREAGGDHGFYLKGGYGYILPLGSLLLKPSLDLYYLNGIDRMGSIDNRQKEISLLGFVAPDQFTVETTDEDDVTTDATYNADHLDVNYRRYSFLAEPKIVLATKPKGRLAVSLEAGWMFQLSQRSVLQFEQEDGSSENGNNVGSISLERNGFLSGPYVALNIGVYLWPKKA